MAALIAIVLEPAAPQIRGVYGPFVRLADAQQFAANAEQQFPEFVGRVLIRPLRPVRSQVTSVSLDFQSPQDQGE